MMSAAKALVCRLAAVCLMGSVWGSAATYAQNGMGEDQATFDEFQIPGAGYIDGTSINNAATVTGIYYPTANTAAGFVRVTNGAYATFNGPGSTFTTPRSISQSGAITGEYGDSAGREHGFVRAALGAITPFDVPGNSKNNTFPSIINVAGTVTGSYELGGLVSHGFVRAASGAITTFDPPGGSQTLPQGMNEAGAITGSYEDSHGVQHGFLRNPSGSFVSFDPAGSIATNPQSINAAGTIAGFYNDGPQHATGFIRAANGTITTFDTGDFGISSTVINAVGIVAGTFGDSIGLHGFVRTTDGTITTFDPPGSQVTIVSAIDDFGAITGNLYTGSTFLAFVRYPTGGNKFQAGAFDVADGSQFDIDGGFYLYGDPTVRLWTLVTGNPNQHWQFSAVPGGFTLYNQGTGKYASDQSGILKEGSQKDIWTVTEVPEGYSIQNNRTGHFLTDPAVKDGAITLTGWGSVWQLFSPE